MDTKKELNRQIDRLSQNLYVVIDKVKGQPDFCTLNFNDVDFIRCNLPIIHSKYQLQDVVVYNLGKIDNILSNFRELKTVDWSSYKFETEAQNLARLGMRNDEIEAYFAEKSKNNRGITEKQIVSIMENLIAKNKAEEK